MPSNSHRHRLILYTYILNRWWRAVLATGIILLGLAAGLAFLPRFLSLPLLLEVPAPTLWAVAGTGAVAICLAIFLLAIRKSAYVQPFRDHLRLVTPFLRLNIGYKRIRRATSAQMQSLFPAAKAGSWQRGFLRPLAKETVIVLDLNGYPFPRAVLELFLSPYFFPGKTPHLILLVPDWMAFSTELESFRSVWVNSIRPPGYADAATLSNPFDPKK